MGPLPFALSIHHFISSVGSDAGFAAIIGLAILILLYFAQARETATLRRDAAESAERVGALEARVAQLTRSQSQPAQAQQAGQASSQPPRVAVPSAAPVPVRMAPAAPAGVGAPALAAATRLIPVSVPAAAPAGSEGPGAPAAPGENGVPQSQPAPAPVAAAVTAGPQSGPPSGPQGPAPATVAGASNGSGRVTPRPGPVVSAAPGMRRPGGNAGAGSKGGSYAGRLAPEPQRSHLPRVLVAAIGALAVVVIVVVLLIVTGGGGSSQSSSTTSASNTLQTRHSTAAVNPVKVTVAVLNGTATNGLAHRIAQQLAGSGYKQGTDGNAPAQTHTSTVVEYLPGYKRDAQSVATSLSLKQTAVRPVDQSTKAVACPGPGGCNANVIVTVGADLANGQ